MSSRQLEKRRQDQRSGSSNDASGSKHSHHTLSILFPELSLEDVLHRRKESTSGEMSGDSVCKGGFFGCRGRAKENRIRPRRQQGRNLRDDKDKNRVHSLIQLISLASKSSSPFTSTATTESERA